MSIQVWHFPLSRPHTGVVLGNGVQGLMVWGEETVCISVGRAGSGNIAEAMTARERRRTRRCGGCWKQATKRG